MARYDHVYQVAGANRSILRSRATAEDGRWRWPFRYRGSRRESAVAQLYSLGGRARSVRSAVNLRRRGCGHQRQW